LTLKRFNLTLLSTYILVSDWSSDYQSLLSW